MKIKLFFKIVEETNIYNNLKKSNFKVFYDDCKKRKRFFIKIGNDFIEVSEEVYKLFKSSYDKIRYEIKIKVERSIISYKDIDQSTFFIMDNKTQNNPIDKIYLHDLAELAKKEIYNLNDKYRDIAICIFLKEMTIKETSEYLGIPNTTVFDRKKKIQKILQKKLKESEFF
ncbi:hypothetical protein [Traorella massiliensis]|uniref:hypothetical protein n=1 Tax=Traorella massiliensis TaxID=1903263 RepID=UPI0008F85168|nr:hypothetical protein [Traorella massiliensis]